MFALRIHQRRAVRDDLVRFLDAVLVKDLLEETLMALALGCTRMSTCAVLCHHLAQRTCVLYGSFGFIVNTSWDTPTSCF